MKTARKFGRMALYLLLCCVMLNCTAFAAGPEVVQFGDVTITLDAPVPDVMPLAKKLIIIDNEPGDCTYNTAYKIGDSTDPKYGNFMVIQVTNTGSVPINITVTYTMDGQSYTSSVYTLTPETKVYSATSDTNTAAGLDISFEIRITSAIPGTMGTFTTYVCQEQTR